VNTNSRTEETTYIQLLETNKSELNSQVHVQEPQRMWRHIQIIKISVHIRQNFEIFPVRFNILTEWTEIDFRNYCEISQEGWDV
jgi:hypothetical protein